MRIKVPAESGLADTMFYRLAFVALALATLASTAKLPKSWKTCRRSEKDLSQCLRKPITDAIRSLKNGNQQLGILPLEPMRFDQLSIDQGTGPVSIKLVWKNLDLRGISDVVVGRILADWDNYYLEGDFTFGKHFYLEGDYTVSGKVLVLPIVGSGKCNLTFDNFMANLTMKGHEITKGKHKHMAVDKFTVGIGTSRLHMNFENLFNGDKALGDNMNIFINENWKEILNELRPSISKAFGQAFKNVANRLFEKVPITQIAPP